jgi:hypothetical protein
VDARRIPTAVISVFLDRFYKRHVAETLLGVGVGVGVGVILAAVSQSTSALALFLGAHRSATFMWLSKFQTLLSSEVQFMSYKTDQQRIPLPRSVTFCILFQKSESLY